MDHVQKEAGLTVIFTPEKDYVIPQNIEVIMGGKELTDGDDYTYESDKKSAVLTIPKVTGAVVVKAAGAVWVDDTVYELEVVDPHGFLTMTTSEDGTVITLRQEAPSGDMSVKPSAEKDRNVSYVLFPESDKYQSMSLTLKVKERLLNSSKTGVYVGAFLLEDPSWYVPGKSVIKKQRMQLAGIG